MGARHAFRSDHGDGVRTGGCGQEDDERGRIDIEGGIAGYRPPTSGPAREAADAAVAKRCLRPVWSRRTSCMPSRNANGSATWWRPNGPRASRCLRCVLKSDDDRTAIGAAAPAPGGTCSSPVGRRMTRRCTYTLYRLCQAGDTAQPVRDYASEVLRTYCHQVAAAQHGMAQLEGFIDKYGLFCCR